MCHKEAVTANHGEKTMVELLVELIKRDLEEALKTPNITFEQVHLIMRQCLEKLLNYDSKYKEQIQKYFDKEMELNKQIQDALGSMGDLKKQLASNDEKMYEAIKNLCNLCKTSKGMHNSNGEAQTPIG